MAFGFLSSIIPEIDNNVTLYSSPSGTLTQGKVSISSKIVNPVRIRLAIRPSGGAGTDLKYLEYDRYIEYGETFETGELNLGSGQDLVVRTDSSDVNFVFNGSSLSEVGANLGSGIFSGYLASTVSTSRTSKILYSVPNQIQTDLTVVICNLSPLAAKARLGLLNEAETLSAFESQDFIEYDVVIPPNTTYTRSGLKLGPTESIICSSSNLNYTVDDSKLQFLVHGRLISTIGGGVEQNNVFGSIGIGTQPRQSLDVIGSVLVSKGIKAVGVITAASFDGSLDATQLTGQLPPLDGSQLTGVTAQGTGITIQDNSSSVGTATTVDFGQGISANFSSGISTVTISSSVDISNTLTVNSNKFLVEGSTGNTTIAGQLNANSGVQVSGQINVLNNNIVNVGYPTSEHHAVSKSYVDSKTTAMSIALS